VLLVADAPPEARELFDRLFTSETEEDMEIGFSDLRELHEWYAEQARKADKALGRERPPIAGRAGQSPMTAAEEWTAFVEAHREPAEGDQRDEEPAEE